MSCISLHKSCTLVNTMAAMGGGSTFTDSNGFNTSASAPVLIDDLSCSLLDPVRLNKIHNTVKMNKLCRQVSIESPGPAMKDCVFNFVVPVPDTPPTGARILVVCAGACYRNKRSPSICSVSSVSSDLSDMSMNAPLPPSMPPSQNSPIHHGLRDSALFPGYEVAGVIEELGCDIDEETCGFKVGQRVIVYPFDGLPSGYTEYLTVPELGFLVAIPDNIPLSVAAMLPTGALLAQNTVLQAYKYVDHLIKVRQRETPNDAQCKILIVGTGGLALWAVRIAAYHFANSELSDVEITIASLKDEGFQLAQEIPGVNVVQWNEDLYEKQLIERTQDACKGMVDIVIDFGTTSRSLHRSLQCLNRGGIVLIGEEIAERLMPKFSRKAEERQQHIKSVANGTIEQLQELVKLVATNQIQPPPHSVFPCEQAADVVRKLCHSEIPGRAILRFHDIE